MPEKGLGHGLTWKTRDDLIMTGYHHLVWNCYSNNNIDIDIDIR